MASDCDITFSMVSQIDPLTRDIWRFFVFFIDFQKARRLPAGFRHRLLFVTFSGLQNAFRIAVCFRHDFVGVSHRFVLQLFFVGARSLHVTERIDDLLRWIDFLQLHLIDADARTVIIEHTLHQPLHIGFGLLPRFCQDGLDIRLPDNFAHDAFGDFFDCRFRFLDVEKIILHPVWLDRPTHDEIYIDDVFIARQHLAFFRHVARSRCVTATAIA